MAAIATSSPVIQASRAVGWGRYAMVGLGTVVAAVLANVLVYYLGRAVVGYDPEFVILRSVSTPIFFTVIPAIGATVIYAALLRFARRPERTFAIVSAVVFVVTLIPDFTLIPDSPGVSAGQTAILVSMHVVSAGVIVGLLTRVGRGTGR